MAEANRFLREVYLPDHDGRFATPSEVKGWPSCPSQALWTSSSASTRNALSRTIIPCEGLSLQLPAVRHRYVRAMIRVHEYPTTPVLAGFHGPRAPRLLPSRWIPDRNQNPKGRTICRRHVDSRNAVNDAQTPRILTRWPAHPDTALATGSLSACAEHRNRRAARKNERENSP